MLRRTVLLCLLTLSCGRLAYDPLAAIDGGAEPDAPDARAIADAGAVDAFFDPAEHFSATCSTGGVTELSIPAGVTMPVGTRIIVRVLVRAESVASASALDSQGNLYSFDMSAEATGSGSKAHVQLLSAELSTTLTDSDTITVNHDDGIATGVAVDVVNFATPGTRITASDESTAPNATLDVPEAGGIVVATMGVSNHTTVDLPVGWTPLPALLPSCGGAPGNADGFAAIRSIQSPGSILFEAAIANDRIWSLGLIQYTEN